MCTYVLVSGSFGYYDRWYQEDTAPFNAMMSTHGFTRHTPQFRWNGGLTPLDWNAAADALGWLCCDLPDADRNFIAYSNGGEVVLTLAARGFQMRTVTTVGTPYRFDVPVARAEEFIGYHQHIYDDLDPVRWLGEWDWPLNASRRFSRAHNYNLHDIGHGKVLFEDTYIAYWEQQGWLAAIEKLETPAELVQA